MTIKKALIMVDLQNDFCKGGSLAVPGGDEVISMANQLQGYFDIVIATQDWHPSDHQSFAVQHFGHAVGDVIQMQGLDQVLWPEHCVQGTRGAEFHSELYLKKIHKIFHKGTDKKIDSYSAFFDNAHLRSTGLSDYLQEQKIESIYIMGLATDYCVKFSALDAVKLGFQVYVIKDACRAVELFPGDAEKAFKEMEVAGVKLISFSDIVQATQ